MSNDLVRSLLTGAPSRQTRAIRQVQEDEARVKEEIAATDRCMHQAGRAIVSFGLRSAYWTQMAPHVAPHLDMLAAVGTLRMCGSIESIGQ